MAVKIVVETIKNAQIHVEVKGGNQAEIVLELAQAMKEVPELKEAVLAAVKEFRAKEN